MSAKGRVLLVEEDPVVQLAIDRQLDALGWDSVSVASGAEAVTVVEMGLLVDVLLTDLELADVDGLAVAWTVSRLLPRVRIAFMADAPPPEPLEPRLAPLLLKPFSTTALANALSAAIRIGRGPSRR